MTRERIDSLIADKRKLESDVQRLQGEVDRLAPENARLKESLGSAEANNIVSTILIVLGGGVISYATFVGNVGPRVADTGAGMLLAGVLVLAFANLRRWIAR